jgi:hypothetical protein
VPNNLVVTKDGKTFIRVSKVTTMLGIRKATLDGLVNQGLLTPIQLKENEPFYIAKSEIATYLKQTMK